VAHYFYELKSEENIAYVSQAYIYALENNLPFLIIGGGTNILFSSPEYHGVVIKNSLSGWNYDVNTMQLQTYSNESIWNIASSLEDEYHQALWHRFIGLPGSVGGAVFGNAGCFGLETESNFDHARIYDMKHDNYLNFTKEEM
jgi:UDP-N-acetylmuramate dehydrogenase